MALSHCLNNGADAVRHYENILAALAKRLSIPRTVAHWAIKTKSKTSVLFNNTGLKFELPAKSDDDKNCQICMEAMDTIDRKEHNVAFLPCDHRVHVECAKAMFSSYAEQNKPLECCCKLGVMMTDKYFKTAKKDVQNLPSAYVKCPDESCERWIYAKPGTGLCVPVTCLCGRSFCHNCKGGVHGNTRCVQVRQLVDGIERIRRINDVNVNDVAKWLVYRYPFAFGVNMPTMSSIIEGQMTPTVPTFDLVDQKIESYGANGANGANGSNGSNGAAVLERWNAIMKGDDSFLTIKFANPLEGLLDSAIESETSRSKFCPKCFVTIGRNGGCPSMTCSMCRYSFCYNCLGPQHTHDECTRPVDLSALAAAGADSKFIAGLSKFSPEGELAEIDREARGDRNSRGSVNTNSRMIRLFPLAMRATRLQALIAANADLEAIANEAAQLTHLIDAEEQLIESRRPYINRDVDQYRGRLDEVLDYSSSAKQSATGVLNAAKSGCVDSLLRELDVTNPLQRSMLLDIIKMKTGGDRKTEIVTMLRSAIEHLSIDEMLLHGMPLESGDGVKIFITDTAIPGHTTSKSNERYVEVYATICVLTPINAVYPGVDDGAFCQTQIAELARIIDLLIAALKRDFQMEEPRMWEKFFNATESHSYDAPSIRLGDMVKWDRYNNLLVIREHATEFELFIDNGHVERAPHDAVTHVYPRRLPFLSAKGNRALHALGVVMGFIQDDSPLHQAKKKIAKSCNRVNKSNLGEWVCSKCTYMNDIDSSYCCVCEEGIRAMQDLIINSEIAYNSIKEFIDALRLVL